MDTSESRVTAVAANKIRLYAVSGSITGKVQRWCTEMREEAGLLGGVDSEELGYVRAVVVSADGRCVADGLGQDRVYVWRVDECAADDAAPAILGAHDFNSVFALAMTDDGSTVVSGGFDFTVPVWRVSDQTAVGDPVKLNLVSTH